MLLKVGTLAKQTGLTVRALHHYDRIGLLKPSGRSAAGYRLYNRDDVARLHAIQVLRQSGLSLAAIGALLAGEGPPRHRIVTQQIEALDREIARATELRGRLVLLQTVLAAGGEPEIEHWLAALRQMRAYRQYFSEAELETIFRQWIATEAEWQPLLDEVREAMAQQWPADAIGTQALAARWMHLAMRWMQGDMERAVRWGEMIKQAAQQGFGGIDAVMVAYMESAVALRMAAWLRHLSPDELARLDKRLEPEWQALAQRARALIAAGTDPSAAASRTLLHDWDALVDRMVGYDAGLREKLLKAYRDEPLLQIGHMVDAEVREFVEAVRAHAGEAGRGGADGRHRRSALKIGAEDRR